MCSVVKITCMSMSKRHYSYTLYLVNLGIWIQHFTKGIDIFKLEFVSD